MNIVGIIAEYNPMHNGHVYNIKKAKELSNADYTIVIMSGSFTEQGNICTIDKFNRAALAIENGADLVIELPTIYATSSSENFARGAVTILNSLNVVTHLAFGAESDNIEYLNNVAKTYVENEKNILLDIKKEMKKGINSGTAYSNVMSKYTNENIAYIFKPNNILGIEYLKTLLQIKSDIKPVLIHRLESTHNSEIVPLNSVYASSTSIRNVLNSSLNIDEKLSEIKDVIPDNTYNILKTYNYNTNEKIWNNLKYEITKIGINGLKKIQGIDEGIETRIYKECLISNSYEEFIFRVKSKRYTLSRIKRICVNILLNITKEKYNKLSNVEYARVLKVKESSSKLLSLISKHSTIPVITKITDETIDSFDSNIKESIILDILANNIANPNLINIDYTNKIKQP